MTTNALPADWTNREEEVTMDGPIELELDAGNVAITPVHVDGETRFALTGVPAEPLTEGDVEGLAAALHAARSGAAVLVDIEDYAETEQATHDA